MGRTLTRRDPFGLSPMRKLRRLSQQQACPLNTIRYESNIETSKKKSPDFPGSSSFNSSRSTGVHLDSSRDHGRCPDRRITSVTDTRIVAVPDARGVIG